MVCFCTANSVDIGFIYKSYTVQQKQQQEKSDIPRHK